MAFLGQKFRFFLELIFLAYADESTMLNYGMASGQFDLVRLVKLVIWATSVDGSDRLAKYSMVNSEDNSEVLFCTVVYHNQDNCITTCRSGRVVRALDLSPEVPGANLLLEGTKFPTSTYSQT